LYKFFVLLMMISHWLACTWAMTLIMVDEKDGQPRWIDSFSEMEEGKATMTKDSIPHLYIASLYFASYTITSVGYGDMGPKNVVERIVCTGMIFISGISWAYVLGQVCGTVASMGAVDQEFRKSMDDLNYMMEERSIDVAMRVRLRSFFLSTRHTQRHARHKDILAKMSPCLQGEVALATNSTWLQKVPFLKEFMENVDTDVGVQSFVLEVSMALDSANYAQSEVFGQPHVLYILQRGLASQRTRILQSGSVWGEDFLLNNPRLLYNVRCYAMTYLELLFCRRKKFIEIMDKQVTQCPELRSRVRRFCVRLAVGRGFVLAARERQTHLKKHKRVGGWLNMIDEDPALDHLAVEAASYEEPSMASLQKQVGGIERSQAKFFGLIEGHLRSGMVPGGGGMVPASPNCWSVSEV